MQCTMHLNGVNQEDNNRGVVFFKLYSNFGWMVDHHMILSKFPRLLNTQPSPTLESGKDVGPTVINLAFFPGPTANRFAHFV